MEIDNSHVTVALESLISEAGPTLTSRKRPSDSEPTSTSTKSSRPSPENSTVSHHGSTSGSITALTEIIRNNRYSESNAGPFDVHVQRLPGENTRLQLHPTFVGRVVCDLNIDDILEIKKIGFSKVSVFFKFRDAANALVDDKRLAAKGLEAFIPPFRTSRKGIIRDVPLDLTDQLILHNTTSPIKVAVNRLNRRINTIHQLNSQTDTSTSVTYSPSHSVSFTFEGQKIPKYVYMFHVRYSVSPYIARVSRCYNCFRFGHIKANCKSQPRCLHCGEKGHVFSEEHCQQTQKPPKCANCRGEHRADSSSCPELAIQKEIRKYAALKNISLLDAREIFKGNKTPPPFSSSSEEFPPISSTQFTVSSPHTRFILSHTPSHRPIPTLKQRKVSLPLTSNSSPSPLPP